MEGWRRSQGRFGDVSGAHLPLGLSDAGMFGNAENPFLWGGGEVSFFGYLQ